MHPSWLSHVTHPGPGKHWQCHDGPSPAAGTSHGTSTSPVRIRRRSPSLSPIPTERAARPRVQFRVRACGGAVGPEANRTLKAAPPGAAMTVETVEINHRPVLRV
eukprot:2732241-Rhodomonas_salina.1